jgi:hypothetical protein
MTTNTKYNDTSKLYRMLEGLGRDIKAIGATVRGMNDTVSDLLARTDCIYDAVTRHPEIRYDGLNSDSFLDEMEE